MPNRNLGIREPRKKGNVLRQEVSTVGQVAYDNKYSTYRDKKERKKNKLAKKQRRR